MQGLEVMDNKNYQKNEHQDIALLPKESASKYKKRWTSTQCFIFGFICMVVGIVATNLARIMTNSTASSSQQNNTPSSQSASLKKMNAYDIIIIGAGPSGLLQTNFIQENHPNLRILVLEKLNRVGGRSCSSVISYETPDNTLQDLSP